MSEHGSARCHRWPASARTAYRSNSSLRSIRLQVRVGHPVPWTWLGVEKTIYHAIIDA